MRSILNEAFEWLDRAEHAREVAGQLTDPSARKAGWSLPKVSIGSPEQPLYPAVLKRRELAWKDQERT